MNQIRQLAGMRGLMLRSRPNQLQFIHHNMPPFDMYLIIP